MFSSKKESSVQAPQAPQQPLPTVAPKRPARSASAPSIISADLSVIGSLNSSGDLQIDGRVDGDVYSGGLVIGEKAVVNGKIFAEELTVRGRVEGSVRARKVLLCATSHVEGDILHEAFAVEIGAFFEGNCRHSDNPLEEIGSDSKKAAPQPTSHPAASSSPVTSMVSRPAAVGSGATAAPLKNGA